MGTIDIVDSLLGKHSNLKKQFRGEIELEKGAILTEDRLIKGEGLLKKYANFFSVYPDIYIDLITPLDSNFSLYFYQRIFLRVSMRFRYHYCVAPRAFSKTFISILAFYLKCMFQPKAKFFICAPGKQQAAQIAKEKIYELWSLFPLLKQEVVGNGNFGNDYVRLTFRNGSIFDVVGALATTRGGRRHGGLIDEVRDHDGAVLNEIVLPLMAVSRSTAAGVVNPKEPHQSQNWMTSSSNKNTFAYHKLIDLFENQIIDPDNYFVWGCDYHVPRQHGLIDEIFINEQKLSPTYDEESFAREYLSLWTGGGKDSWFNYDKMTKYRKLVNPEFSRNVEEGSKVFYLLAVDVARTSCQTVVTVLKVYPRQEGFYTSVVNIIVLGKTSEEKIFSTQAIDLKKIIAAFKPIEVVIDGKGLGVGLIDNMVQPSVEFGNVYPAYGVTNDPEYKKVQSTDAIDLIYIMKATESLNSEMHGNCFSRINGGRVKFLIREQEAKLKMLATSTGRRLPLPKRVARLMPHEMTTQLFSELANLKLKPTGSQNVIKLEQINKNMTKDKFSSLEYGLWRVKEREDVYYARRRRVSGGTKRKLVFFSGG